MKSSVARLQPIRMNNHKITSLTLYKFEAERNKILYTIGIYLSIVTFFVAFISAGCLLETWVVTL